MNRSKWVHLPLCVIALIVIAGCADSSKGGAGSIGKKLGENVTEFAQGVGSGIDQQMQIKVELASDVVEAGLSSTVASQKIQAEKPAKGISVYFIASKAIKGTLLARAFNSGDQEVGRAASEVSLGQDDAEYIVFDFPAEMDRQTVTVYKISLKAVSPAPESSEAKN